MAIGYMNHLVFPEGRGSNLPVKHLLALLPENKKHL